MPEAIHLYQKRAYMRARELGLTQADSSWVAEISERTGQRIEAGNHRSNRGEVREPSPSRDPLADVWRQELEPMLRQEPRLKPTTLFEYLQEKYPDRYPQVLRTLQRRVRSWKAVHGPAQTVMFELRHEPGVMGLSDFTKVKKIDVTIKGEPFDYLLYHYRLAYSGWQYAQIICGGESFVSLSEGLQNALSASGGAPKEHRTDSLSAAYRNLGGHRKSELTRLYDDLCDHYRMVPTRNNKGIAHENGSVESPHGHLKNRIRQAIYLRGSADFESVADYQAVVDKAVAGLNRQCQSKFEAEQAVLQALPKRRVADYEVLTAKVSCHSTIEVRCVLYSVPSRLIGHRVEIHLYHDRLVGYFARKQVFEVPRLRVKGRSKRRARCIDYRHVVAGLRKKPRAFLFCKWQQDLLPTVEFKALWAQIKQQFERDMAAVLMVEALYIAAVGDQEQAVADYLTSALEAGNLTLSRLQRQFTPSATAVVPELTTQQHSLASYDQLLNTQPTQDTEPDGSRCESSAGRAESIPAVKCTPQTAQTHSYAFPLGSYREPRIAAALVLCAVLASAVRERDRTTLPSSAEADAQRSATAGRKKFYQL